MSAAVSEEVEVLVATLREAILSYYKSSEVMKLGGKGSVSKAQLRQAHAAARTWLLRRDKKWIEQRLRRYKPYFASGEEIEPTRIQPQLIEVREKWQRDLFRLARYFWSVPSFSGGFGRRLRFLILDQAHNKLIGLLGLQSPPLDLAARDTRFRYPEGRKSYYINQTLDISTLGALPPYNFLLGGKLIAYIAASNEVREAYQKKYAHALTQMENRFIPAHLVALTTTSAFGRSSLYNRLYYSKVLLAESLGFTQGYGIFHLMPFYDEMVKLVEKTYGKRQTGYGSGPRPAWQVVDKALRQLKLPESIMRHSIPREVFLFRLIENLEDYMEGRTDRPIYRHLPFAELVDYWRTRWLLPRLSREERWKSWQKEEFIQSLLLDGTL
ncbi:MAG: DUF4338 domain-containing protein [Bacteroidia bacterium]|nr:DUF4338 domain-containing protein [Bacteroidia bacterium]